MTMKDKSAKQGKGAKLIARGDIMSYIQKKQKESESE